MVKYLRRAEAAERMHLSVAAFKLIVANGGVRYELTPGGQKVYDPHEIDRYMAEKQALRVFVWVWITGLAYWLLASGEL